MFLFHPEMIVDTQIENARDIQALLENRTAVFGTYLLLLNVQAPNVLEILHSPDFFKRVNENRKWVVVGIAQGRPASRQLVLALLQRLLDAGGDPADFKKATLSRLKGNEAWF